MLPRNLECGTCGCLYTESPELGFVIGAVCGDYSAARDPAKGCRGRLRRERQILTKKQVRRQQDLIAVGVRHEHASIARLMNGKPDAAVLWALGLVYSAEYKTNGFIPDGVVPRLVALPTDVRSLALQIVNAALRRS